MSLAKSSLLIIPQDSSPVKGIKTEISLMQTQASSDDITSFSENLSEKSTSSPVKDNFPSEVTSQKLQLAARTAVSTSRVSLLSTCNGNSSFSQSVNTNFEDLKANESLLWDKITKENIKEISVEEPKVKVQDEPKASIQEEPKTKVPEEPKEKVQGEFRDKYIARLKSMKKLDSQNKEKHQSFMLIDWDGALFGGIDIEEVKSNQKSIKGNSILKMLDETASTLLAKAAAHCPVFIITSYSEKTVEYNLRLYLPLTCQVFVKHNIQIISLRTDDEEKENYGSFAAKGASSKGLMSLKKKFRDDIGTNMICVVDSETKIEIIEKFAEKFQGALVKFMRFKNSVKVSQLIKQQELLTKEFENMFFSLRSFTMQFAKNQGKK